MVIVANLLALAAIFVRLATHNFELAYLMLLFAYGIRVIDGLGRMGR